MTEICNQESINIEEDGIDTIIKLADGDMRKVFNILESAQLAHSSKIEPADIYASTGRPNNTQIMQVFKSLCKNNFKENYDIISKLKKENGFTLDDIVNELHVKIVKSKFEKQHKIKVIKRLAEVQERIAYGCSEYMQIASLIAIFVEIRSE